MGRGDITPKGTSEGASEQERKRMLENELGKKMNELFRKVMSEDQSNPVFELLKPNMSSHNLFGIDITNREAWNLLLASEDEAEKERIVGLVDEYFALPDQSPLETSTERNSIPPSSREDFEDESFHNPENNARLIRPISEEELQAARANVAQAGSSDETATQTASTVQIPATTRQKKKGVFGKFIDRIRGKK